MEIYPFLHQTSDLPTTLSEMLRVQERVESQRVIGAFAYATQSGVASFELEFGSDFLDETQSRWLFGIDYGRTQPRALRKICERAAADVRIVDGAWVVRQKGFIPRRDFHAKMTLFTNATARRYGAVIGSGNFSSNGLRRSIEAGNSLLVGNAAEYRKFLRPCEQALDELWRDSTPALRVIDAYEEHWEASFNRRANAQVVEESDLDHFAALEEGEIFWIEAGYVTKNRGADRPGNQIDFPRGVTARYFGFRPRHHLQRNAVIGPVTFEPPIGGTVTNNLRLGNNMMEKISLPIPETHGFDLYDGKVLIFQRSGRNFVLRALEADDFETAFGDRLDEVRAMGSGRRYGRII